MAKMGDCAAKFVSEFFCFQNLGIIQMFMLHISPTRPEIRLFSNWDRFSKCFSVDTNVSQ